MRLVHSLAPPALTGTGLTLTLTGAERELKAALAAFRTERLEPAARAIDAMPADAIAAPGSEWHALVADFMGLGIDVDAIYLSEDKRAGNRLKAAAFEELGRGDAGFAIGMMVAFFPYVMCRLLKRDDLADLARGKVGCWIATQNGRGSDVGDVEGREVLPGRVHHPDSLRADLQGNTVILNGSSSPWVSLGSVADVALAYLPLRRDGEWVHAADGTLESVAVFIPLDSAGVSRGAPLEKLGQKAVPQGAIHLRDVRLPASHIVASPGEYRKSLMAALCEGNQTMGAVFTGLAQRAFDHVLEHVRTRRQGGAALIEHQLVRYRVFEMFRKIQTLRATMMQTFDYNALADDPHILASATSKITVTEGAVEVVGEAIRLFGGRGLTPELPMEKLLRDARASLTEDGDNHLLALISASAFR